jgi:hypothetical protein
MHFLTYNFLGNNLRHDLSMNIHSSIRRRFRIQAQSRYVRLSLVRRSKAGAEQNRADPKARFPHQNPAIDTHH